MQFSISGHTKIHPFGPYRVLGKPKKEMVQKWQFITTYQFAFITAALFGCHGNIL